MKMLVYRTPIASRVPFSIADLRAHLRVADGSEDMAITKIGLAAAAEIEQFAQIALLDQMIRVTIFGPKRESSLRLPIGPVRDGVTPTVTIDGEPFNAFNFAAGNRPYINWLVEYHDLTPNRMTIEYQAGFGPTMAEVPYDLAQALLDQAALLYDGRSPMDAKALTTSPHMARVGARYRGVSA
ncbi:MAG: hypothetical protein AAGF30_06080 [Pseudomonadota bacterium]